MFKIMLHLGMGSVVQLKAIIVYIRENESKPVTILDYFSKVFCHFHFNSVKFSPENLRLILIKLNIWITMILFSF